MKCAAAHSRRCSILPGIVFKGSGFYFDRLRSKPSSVSPAKEKDKEKDKEKSDGKKAKASAEAGSSSSSSSGSSDKRRRMIGVFGGTGFYEFLDEARTVEVDHTLRGTSAPATVGEVDGVEVAFIPRQVSDHQYPPHLVPYRANAWAMKELGVDRIIGPCAAGSLVSELGRGHLVVPDQLVDRTWGRPSTFYDGPEVVHIAFADPYCPELRPLALELVP